MSAGDVDGDGQYELIVKWDPSNSKRQFSVGHHRQCLSGLLQAGWHLRWRIDLGMNIRAGAHIRSSRCLTMTEMERPRWCAALHPWHCGWGWKNVLMGSDQVKDYRNSKGYILSGPEYLTVFNGNTGAQITRWPITPPAEMSAWGDTYGKPCGPFSGMYRLSDGVHPSMVFCRGYYTQSNLVAYDFKTESSPSVGSIMALTKPARLMDRVFTTSVAGMWMATDMTR